MIFSFTQQLENWCSMIELQKACSESGLMTLECSHANWKEACMGPSLRIDKRSSVHPSSCFPPLMPQDILLLLAQWVLCMSAACPSLCRWFIISPWWDCSDFSPGCFGGQHTDKHIFSFSYVSFCLISHACGFSSLFILTRASIVLGTQMILFLCHGQGKEPHKSLQSLCPQRRCANTINWEAYRVSW